MVEKNQKESKLTDDVIKTLNQARKAAHLVEGELSYHLELFGDKLAKENGFSSSVSGMDAVNLYLIKRYSWTPMYVKSMSNEDKRLVLDVEMKGWVIPKEGR